MAQAERKMISKTGKRTSGFSVTELLVVIGIIILMLGISVPYFAKFGQRSKLEAAATNIATTLRTARNYAITNNNDYIVHFDASVTPNQYWITDNLNNLVGKKYSLPTNIDIYRPSDPTHSITLKNNMASFNSRGGLNSVDGSVWISLGPGHIKFKRIMTESTTGSVKIDETS